MTQIETWLKTDLQQVVRVQTLDGNLFTADNGANRIGVIVTKGGKPVDVTGNIWGYLIMPDEGTLVIEGDSSENKAWVDLPKSAYTKTGPFSLVIKDGETTIGGCTGYIYRSTTDEIIDPGHVVPDIAELLAEIGNMRSATAAATEAATNANTKAGLANEAAANANTKAGLANEAATNANTKAGLANEAAATANAAAVKIDNMTVAPSALPSGSNPTVTISEVDGHKHIIFGMVKGDPGKDFRIKKTFVSISAMQAYDPAQDPSAQKMEENDFAMIDTGSVEDPDTGKLFCYEPTTQEIWRYIGDLSGAQGIKGEDGTGIASAILNADYTLTLTFTDGTTFTTPSIRGAKGDPGEVTEAELNAIIVHDAVTNVPIATVPDGAAVPLSALKIAIDPIQDLHGQSSPYPAGGGKNKLPITVTTSTTSGVTFTVNDDGTIATSGTATADIDKAINTTTILVSGESYKLAGCASGSDGSNYYMRSTRGIIAGSTGPDFSYPVTATSEALYLFIHISNGVNTNGLVFKPMICLATETDYTFAPYENICPITGWTGCNVARTGVNVWDEEWELGDINSTTGAIFSGNYIVSTNMIPIFGNTSYYFKRGSNNAWLYFYDVNGEYFRVSSAGYRYIPSGTNTFLSPQNARYVRFVIDISYGTTYNNDISINYPATDTAYHTGTGNATIPISWQDEAGTVHRGTLTVNADGTGTLVADMASVDLGTLIWVYNSDYSFFVTTVYGKKAGVFNAICSNYPNGGWWSDWANEDNVWCGNAQNNGFVLKDTRYQDAVSFTAAMSGVQLVYELETPVTYNLTDLEVIETLNGINNVWADTGNVLLMEYGCDTKAYVEKRLSASRALMELIVTANRESEMKASKAYSAGDLLIVNNTLYKVSASIANGATLTVGTNVTATTVAAELAALT